eukprot:14110691-Ditylum_brightwellii.AAC.2
MAKVKVLTIKEYISKLHKMLYADMNRDYTMTAIGAHAILVLQYTIGIMKWRKDELRKLDVKTQTMLTMKGFHHLKGNVHCQYLHRSKGRRGLTGLEDTHNCECTVLVNYVLNITDMLTQMVCKITTLMQKFLLKFASSSKFTTPELMDDTHH